MGVAKNLDFLYDLIKKDGLNWVRLFLILKANNTNLYLKLPNKELNKIKISGILLYLFSLCSLLNFNYLSAIYQNFH